MFCSLLVVLNYLEADEKQHLKEMQNRGEDATGHIYFDIEAIAKWARKHKH